MSNPTAALSAPTHVTVWTTFNEPSLTWCAPLTPAQWEAGVARVLIEDAAYYGATLAMADAIEIAGRLIDESARTGRPQTEGSEDDIRVLAY